MHTCMTQYCNTAHTKLLWTVTTISTVIVVISRKKTQPNKQNIPRPKGKDVNSYALGHKTVCGLGGNFPGRQAVSVTTYHRDSGMLV